MKRSLVRIGLAALAIGLVVSCSEKEEEAESSDKSDESSGGTSAPGVLHVSQLNDLPNVVDPVLVLAGDAETEAFNSPSGQLQISLEASLQAQEGVSLGQSTKADHYESVSNPSYGSCEMVNRLRGILHEAAAADLALCDFRTFFGTDDIPESLMDGKDHVVAVTEEGQEIERYKINITKDGDKVTAFKFYRCEDSTFDFYVEKAVDTDNTVAIMSKRSGSDNNGPNNISYKSKTSVTGEVDTDGKFVGLKTMVQTYSNDFQSDGSDVSYNQFKLVQSSKNLALTGFMTQTTAEDPTLMLAFFELGDANEDGYVYDLQKLSVGAGALIFDSGGGATEQGWSASGSVDSSSKWLPKIEGKADELPTPPASDADKVELDFEGDEDWDCGGTVSLTIREEDLDLDEDDEPCESLSLPQSQSMHLECHEYQ